MHVLCAENINFLWETLLIIAALELSYQNSLNSPIIFVPQPSRPRTSFHPIGPLTRSELQWRSDWSERPHCGDGKDVWRDVWRKVRRWCGRCGLMPVETATFTLAAVSRSCFSTCGIISAQCWSNSYITHQVSFPAGASL